jgi:hypothetical protein
MALLCLLTNTPWPWPTPARAASAGCGKSGRQASRRPEEANTWSCTELFPSPCARQEQRSSARFGFLAGRGAQEIVFAVVFALGGGALRGGLTSPQRFSLAWLGFLFSLIRGVQRGYFSFREKAQRDREGRRATDFSQGPSPAISRIQVANHGSMSALAIMRSLSRARDSQNRSPFCRHPTRKCHRVVKQLARDYENAFSRPSVNRTSGRCSVRPR